MATKATVHLKITTEVEIPHSDYLGPSASIEEHIKRATTTVKSWNVLIQKPGTQSAKVVPARVILDRVVITEE